MDWQQPASLAVVALAGFLFVRREIRSRQEGALACMRCRLRLHRRGGTRGFFTPCERGDRA